MSKQNRFYINGFYTDENYNGKNDKEIIFAKSDFRITVEADDMKQAYDIAMDYMPKGSEIVEICRDKSTLR